MRSNASTPTNSWPPKTRWKAFAPSSKSEQRTGKGSRVPQLIRVLSESDRLPPLEELRRVLPESFDVAVTDGDEESWHSLELRQTDGELVALIERKLAEEGSAIQEFTPHLNNAIAVRATEWLKHYLSHVRTIYTLEPM